MFIINKYKINKKYLQISIYVVLVFASIIAIEKILGNIGLVSVNIKILFSRITTILLPFIYAIFIAYLLNPTCNFVEAKLFSKATYFNTHLKARRSLSVLLTYVFLIGCIVWIIAYLVPEISESIRKVILSFQNIEETFNYLYYESDYFKDTLIAVNNTFGTNYTYVDIMNMILKPLSEKATSIPTLLTSVLMGTVGIASLLLNFVIGLIVAFYMLCEKETYGRIAHKFIFTIFHKRHAEKIIFISKSSNEMFEKFFMGKAIDSTIIGILFFITTFFIDVPYAVLLSLIVGVTNMIPYFGPFIGGIAAVFIVLLNAPAHALWVLIDIFILQQFDGTILGPKILGDSTGLKPIGVIFSIVVGGALFGVLGMFLGVPCFAVLKNMVSSIVNKKYDEKYIIPEEKLNIE